MQIQLLKQTHLYNNVMLTNDCDVLDEIHCTSSFRFHLNLYLCLI